MSVEEWLYRRLARTLLPRELRERYGEPMAEAFGDRLRGVRGVGRWILIARELAELVRTGAKERWKDREITSGGRGLYYALRTLRASPTFTIAALTSLGLGVGLNALVLAVGGKVLLQPLPYPQSDELVQIWSRLGPESDLWALDPDDPTFTVSPEDYMGLRTLDAFAEVEAYNVWRTILTGRGGGVTLAGSVVTPGLFEMLGVRPVLGRAFREADGVPGAERVALLSHGLWTTQFGADPEVVGTTVELNGTAYRVVGVLPIDYVHPESSVEFAEPDVWVPLRLDPSAPGQSRYLRVLGRLGPDTSLREADAQVRARAAAFLRARPERNRGVTFLLRPLRDELFADTRPIVWLSLLAVGAVLLIVCANVGNLVLVRGVARRREFAVRAALGAGRRAVYRQLLSEHLLLGLGGAGLALGVLWLTLPHLSDLPNTVLPPAAAPVLDVPILLIPLGLGLLSGVLLTGFSLPLATRMNVATTLRDDSLRSGTGREGSRLRNVLAALQVSLATAFLVAALLLGRSLRELGAVGLGVRVDAVITAVVQADEAGRDSPEATVAFFDGLADRLAAVPGVARVSFTSDVPFISENRFRTLERLERPFATGEAPSVEYQTVGTNFFETMGIRLLRGRTFQRSDGLEAPPVVVVNAALATLYWASRDPLGRRVSFEAGGDTVQAEVVGVVADVMDDGPRGTADPFFYVHQFQDPVRGGYLVVRTHEETTAVQPRLRAALRRLVPDTPLDRIVPLRDFISDRLGRERLATTLALALAGLALLLAGLGVYAVMSFTVASRTRELGVRLALGAKTGSLWRLVLGRTLRLVFGGVPLGLGLAWAGSGVLESYLFGVSRLDPWTYLLAPLLLTVTAVVAALLPARRALGVAPAVVLREG